MLSLSLRPSLCFLMCSIRLDEDVIEGDNSSLANEDGLDATSTGIEEEVVLDDVAGRTLGHCSRPLLAGHGNLQQKGFEKQF